MKILVLDNYDSFTYNLVYIIRELGYGNSMDIIRNDKISLEEVDAYDKILLSPGPGLPSEAGIMPDLIKNIPQVKIFWEYVLGTRPLGRLLAQGLSTLQRLFTV